MTQSAKSTPRDAQVMSTILADMGITEYEPRVINQMLEFSYRYISEVLEEAKVYSVHFGKKNIDSEDVRVAVQSKLDHSFTNPPPRDLLLDVSRHKNATPLPAIKPFTGPKLPPDRYCLTSSNFRLSARKTISIEIDSLKSSRAHDSNLSMKDHVDALIAAGGNTMYALNILKHHGMSTEKLQQQQNHQVQGHFMRPTMSVPRIPCQPFSGSSRPPGMINAYNGPKITIKPRTSAPQPLFRLASGPGTVAPSISAAPSPFPPPIMLSSAPAASEPSSLKRKHEDDDEDYDI